MTRINIFIAGGTSELEQKKRDEIRIILSKLQNLRFEKGKEVAIYVRDYNDFPESNQYIYDEYIKNEADIVIFLVDPKFKNIKEDDSDTRKHEGTFAEFETACDSFKEKGRPEIVVLYRTSNTQTKSFLKWANRLNEIDSTKRYVIAKVKYERLYDKLKLELTGDSNNGLINKIIAYKEQNNQSKVQQENILNIGDEYSSENINGIIVGIKENKYIIMSPKPHIGSWMDYNKYVKGIWRIPKEEELKEIFLNRDKLNAINNILKESKKGVSFSKKETIWCLPTERTSHPSVYKYDENRVVQRYTTYQGYFRLFADVKI